MHVKSWMIYANNQLMRTLLLRVHSFMMTPWRKEIATYSNILAEKIPWTGTWWVAVHGVTSWTQLND